VSPALFRQSSANWNLSYEQLKEKGFYAFGGWHSYRGAVKAAQAFQDGEVPARLKDERWHGWPSKVYCFPGQMESYSRTLMILADEDNRNHLKVHIKLGHFV
jgi:hypothetical protein